MEREALNAAITAERLDLSAFLDDLSPADWQVTTLCPGWSVQDVVAHLTLTTRSTVRDVLKGAIKARGNFDRMEADAARARARVYTAAELTEQLRETASSTHRAPLSSPLDPLLDLLVHGQDIARPLGRNRAVAPDRAVAALDYALQSRWYGARKRFDGVRLVATDADWSGGPGPDDVRGSLADLLLLSTGRVAGLESAAGTGVDRLAARMGAPETKRPG